MCEALKELFADDLRESREQGIIEGRIEGRNRSESTRLNSSHNRESRMPSSA